MCSMMIVLYNRYNADMRECVFEVVCWYVFINRYAVSVYDCVHGGPLALYILYVCRDSNVHT